MQKGRWELTLIVRSSIQDESRRMRSFYKFSICPVLWLYQSRAAPGSLYLPSVVLQCKIYSIILLFGCSSFQLETLLCDPFSPILGTSPTFKLRLIYLMSLNPIHVFAKWAKDLQAVNFKALPYCTYYKKCIQALVALKSKAFIHS